MLYIVSLYYCLTVYILYRYLELPKCLIFFLNDNNFVISLIKLFFKDCFSRVVVYS